MIRFEKEHIICQRVPRRFQVTLQNFERRFHDTDIRATCTLGDDSPKKIQKVILWFFHGELDMVFILYIV